MSSTQHSSPTAAEPPSTGGTASTRQSPVHPSASAPSATLAAVILAAGQGTRMRSRTHKVLHPLVGKPLIQRVLDLVAGVGAPRPVVILGHLADQVRAALPEGVPTALQAEQLGTGHAVLIAREQLQALGSERLLVHYADCALVKPASLRRLVEQPIGPEAPIALLNARVPDPRGYGRILRAADGTVAGMVEEAEATAEQRQIDEIWPGVMLLWTPWLWERLARLPRRSKGEYYLPDLVNMARTEGRRVLATLMEDAEEAHGVNDRLQLAEANAILWRRTREAHLRAGVTILDPATTYIEPEVEVAADVVIHPGCHLRGHTRIAADCEIGPNSVLVDATVGERSRVLLSVVEHSRIGRDVTVGPFAHLRGGAEIEDGVELGNYAEVKGSRIGEGTKMHHFSYVGDAEIGKRVNVSAGVITLNYDGVRKHRTVVGDDAFLGSDSLLRAPIHIGEGARTGAGAVVTRDVAAGETVAGVPARPLPARREAAPTPADQPSPPADESRERESR